MSDQTVTISEMKDRVRKFVEEREWTRYHKPKDIAISISIESSELLECFQWLGDDEIESMIKDHRKLKEIESELADVMIYCLSLSNALGTDLSRDVLEKLKENELKYPLEKTKGFYRKYTKPDA